MKNLKIYLIITVLVVLALSTMLIKTNNSVIILNNTKRELLATNEIEEANYKVESPLTYTKTLGEAVNVADENSTITVLKDCNDDSEVTISKNLTIDLQDKSLKREGTITVNNGAVLTARGSGEIIQDGNSNMFTLTDSAKLVKRGTALWRAWEGYAIHSTNSSFELYGGYVVSDFSRTIYANNIQKSLIKDTTVYTGTYTDYAIRATGNGNLTIGGNSKIGNGPQVSVNGNLEPVSVIGWASTGFLTLNGNATIYENGMGSCGIVVGANSHINCYGNSSIYVNFDEARLKSLGARTYGYDLDKVNPSGNCILLDSSARLEMNSTGNFFTQSSIAVSFKTDSKGNSGYYVFTKGKLATRINKYTVWRYDRYTTHYQDKSLNNGKPVKERIYEMYSYNDIKSNVWNVYEYKK